MPSFFDFQQGSEAGGNANDSTPLLGRFRAVPNAHRSSRRNRRSSFLGDWSSAGTFSRGYQTLLSSDGRSVDGGDFIDAGDLGVLQRWGQSQKDLWLEPTQAAVATLVERFWSRWACLVLLPAAIAVVWCAIPFPQYELPDDPSDDTSASKTPGHGAVRVAINFWYFLFVYYGLYNLTALVWITKVFNMYGLNWWPDSLGFPATIFAIAVFSVTAPIPIYYLPDLCYITTHNTAWICWTFFTMAIPFLLAMTSLLSHERHLGLRYTLSETQRNFTFSWWASDITTISPRDRARRVHIQSHSFEPAAPRDVTLVSGRGRSTVDRHLLLHRRWIPASFVRFIWFCAALFIAMSTYVLGEAYAEIYLRTLPHSTFQTIVYVYTWVVTVHLLDGLVGWILGGSDGQRVGSYPLGWTFKLYFSLTYQTYVRALYARLRSPSQFLVLQVISSSFLIILAPLTMCQPFHAVLKTLGMNGQTLPQYQKFCARNIFIRSLAECVSMVAFLGSILVLHYGANKNVYPYFAFDGSNQPVQFSPGNNNLPSIGNGESYDFGLTFYASIVTFACEIVAAWIVRQILWYRWKMNVTGEAVHDLGTWPELLPTSIVVMCCTDFWIEELYEELAKWHPELGSLQIIGLGSPMFGYVARRSAAVVLTRTTWLSLQTSARKLEQVKGKYVE